MGIYDINGNSLGSGNTLPLEGKKEVFIGDSVCCFDKATGGIGAVPDYMANLVGGTWYNFCIGGTTMGAYKSTNNTYDMFTFGELADSIASGSFSSQETGITNGVSAGTTSYSASSKVADMKKLNWDAVDTLFVHFGTNDIAYGNSVGTANDAPSKNGTMVASLKYAINTILDVYPQMKIIICGVMYRYSDKVMVSSIIPVNKVLKDACHDIGIPFVDLLGEMGLNEKNKDYFLSDGTHPNANGKRRYAQCLAKYI